MKLNRSVAIIGASAVLAGGSVLVATTAFGEGQPAQPAPTAEYPQRGKHGFGASMLGGLDPEFLSAQVGKLPKELRADLADVLTTDDEKARAELITQIKAKAESGGYGDKIKQHLGRTKDFGKRFDANRPKHKGFWADAPKALKDDLAALRELPRDERKAAFDKIVAKAKAGKYGDEVKQKFEKFGQRHQMDGKRGA